MTEKGTAFFVSNFLIFAIVAKIIKVFYRGS